MRCGFFRRALSALIDGVAIVIVMIALLFIVMFLMRSFVGPDLRAQIFGSIKVPSHPTSQAPPVKLILISWLLFLPYIIHLLVEALTGRTIGKLVTGMAVANVNGSTLDPRLGIVRAFLKFSPVIFMQLAYLLAFMPLLLIAKVLTGVLNLGCILVFTSERRTVHDVISGTAVYPVSEVEPEVTIRPRNQRSERLESASYDTW